MDIKHEWMMARYRVVSFYYDAIRYLRHHGLLPPLDLRGIKVGDHVVIPEVEGYKGVTGTVVEVQDDTYDDMVFHVKFDKPREGISEITGEALKPLHDEYFAPFEVEVLKGG